MVALQVREDSVTGRVVMRMPILPRLGSSAGSLLWIGFLAVVFLFPMLSGGRVDWENLIIFGAFLLFGFGSTLLTVLISTTVTIDRGARTMESVQSLLIFPIRSSTVNFSELANIEVQYYRQSSGRSSHDAWRVNAIDKNGKRVPVNWDGKNAEMVELAQKIAGLTGAEMLDNAAKPESTVQRFFGQMKPQPEASAPEAQPSDPTLPAAPMPDILTIDLPEPQESAPVPANDLRALSVGELEQRVAGDTMDSDARYALARQYFARGNADRAIALYQETLRIDPTNAGAQNDLGVALQARGKRADAETAFRRAIALDPFSSTAHLNLGLLLSGMKRAAEASQEFYQARQNARGDDETRAAEAASTGAKMEPRMSKGN